MVGQQGAAEESQSGFPPGTQQLKAVAGPWGGKALVIPGACPGSEAALQCPLGKPLSFSELFLHL